LNSYNERIHSNSKYVWDDGSKFQGGFLAMSAPRWELELSLFHYLSLEKKIAKRKNFHGIELFPQIQN
jgi:hypothetical protein